MSELKSCPHCGSENVMIDDLWDNGTSTAFCGDCQSKSSNFCEYGDAVKSWNARAPQSEWISVEDFTPVEHCYVHAYCNDIVNGWVELLKVYVCPEYGNYSFETLAGDDYECIPAIITHVKLVDKPTPPKEL